MTRKLKPVIQFEQLEPRIMLSGDSLLNIAPNPQQDTILDNTSLTDQYAELLDTQEQVEEQISLELAPSDTSNADVYQPVFTFFIDDNNTNDESIDADLSIDNIGSTQTGEIALLLYDSNEDIESNIGTIEDDSTPTYINDADLSIEYATSIEIRGPPASDSLESDSISVTLEDVAFQAENSVLDEYTGGVQTQGVELPGLYLVDPDVGCFSGPVIYLDFDGAQDITYNGPVVVEDIDFPEFSADAAGLAGQEQQIISQILIELERTFQESGVIFTSTEPDFGTEYSTILIGGDDFAFRAYGRFGV